MFPGYRQAKLSNYVVLKPEEEIKAAPPPRPSRPAPQVVPTELRREWGDFVYWDRRGTARRRSPATRSAPASRRPRSSAPSTSSSSTARRCACARRSTSSRSTSDETFDLQTTSEVCNVDPQAVRSLARQLAANKGNALLAAGMGPNHYFNNDLFGRVHFLVAALTDNIGHFSGNVGSYAGNYRGSLFQAMGQWIAEDPFDIEPDLTKPATVKRYYKAESAHYWNYGERPLRSPQEVITRATHMPTPTKLIWFGNSNSLLGNAKWSFDVVKNTLPKQEAVFCNEWHWTSSCEYSDIVFPADSWAEFKLPDMTASCTNPFLLAEDAARADPRHALRLRDPRRRRGAARRDLQRAAHARVLEGSSTATRPRTSSASSPARTRPAASSTTSSTSCGRRAAPHEHAHVPAARSWEQRQEDKPWYTPTGRLEFYRPEREWQEAGESLPSGASPSTRPSTSRTSSSPTAEHPSIAPRTPEEYGVPESQLDVETRQYRNVVRTWQELKLSKHPLTERDPAYRFIFQTPKYRWGAHSTAVDSDWIAMLFGPFGDPYRRDPRTPWTGEAYAEINPRDAKSSA